VSVIDGVTNAVVATVPVGDGPTALGHNPAGNKVYVSNVGAPGPNTPPACSVSVIGASTNTVVKTLAAGDEPTAFCYSPNDRRMYWVNEWTHSLAVVDAATDTPVAVLPLGSGQVQPVDMACNSVNGRVYTANRLTYAIGVLDTVAACAADLDGSGSVGGPDLAVLLSAWQTSAADLTGDGQTDGADLGALLAAWGPC
jgi:DNA-binding beta-propeller fold protein YncE